MYITSFTFSNDGPSLVAALVQQQEQKSNIVWEETFDECTFYVHFSSLATIIQSILWVAQ